MGIGICRSSERGDRGPEVGRNIISSEVHSAVILDSSGHADVHKYYLFKRVIGHGHFGTVRIAAPLRNPQQPDVAIKSINKSFVRNDIHMLRREIEILMLVDHPNIIRYYKSYEDDRYIHIVQELCVGGDLLDRLGYVEVFSEDTVASLMRKIISAVHHLHSLFICHRDIKPENFLFTSRELGAEVKMIDFGMSAKFGRHVEQLNTMVGTPNYLAPEVLTARYGKECDVWSLGVMLYYLLSAHLPFEGDNIAETFRKISLAEFDFSGEEWSDYSSEVKDLISRMLLSNPAHRITLPAALKHKWFAQSASSRRESIEVPHNVLTSITKYKPPSKLQQEVMKVMVKHLSAKDIEGLNTAFKQLDKENTGMITPSNLEAALLKAGVGLQSEEVRKIVESMDVLQHGGIKYSSFLVATLDRKKFFNEEVMYMAFKHLDADDDGFISTRDLKSSLEAAGESVPDQEINEMIRELSPSGEPHVSYEVFKRMMEGTFHTEFDSCTQSGGFDTSGAQSRRSSVMRRVSMITETFS